MSGSVQLASSNIRINGIAPGFTKTSILTSSSVAEKGAEYKLDQTVDQLKDNHVWFFERAGLLAKPEYYFNRQAEADEMANVAVFLASNLATGINGQVILADSGKVAGATGETTTGPIPPIKPLELV
jgi:3-oxoacyl-[acyl-carrier protein] reductase